MAAAIARHRRDSYGFFFFFVGSGVGLALESVAVGEAGAPEAGALAGGDPLGAGGVPLLTKIVTLVPA